MVDDLMTGVAPPPQEGDPHGSDQVSEISAETHTNEWAAVTAAAMDDGQDFQKVTSLAMKRIIKEYGGPYQYLASMLSFGCTTAKDITASCVLRNKFNT